MSPTSPRATARTASTAASAASRAARAGSSSAVPASVNVTRRVVRSRSRDPQLPLESRDRRAERLLGDVQPLRGTREVELLRDGDEVPQVPQLDIHTIGV